MNKDAVTEAVLVYLRAIRLNERKIAIEWRDCQTASSRRDAAAGKLRRLARPQIERDPSAVVILSSRASGAQRDEQIWGDRADASASAVLLLADRSLRRLHRVIATNDPIRWQAGEFVDGVATSQAVIAGSNAIRHADEWDSMILANGNYDKTHPNFERAQKSISIIQALLRDSGPIAEPRSADILNALSTDGESSAQILLRRLNSVASSAPIDLAAVQDELDAEDEYIKADFDFVV